MNMPPTRYRVVERGRRLVVIDTLHGNLPVSHTPRAAHESRRPRALEAPKPAHRPSRPAPPSPLGDRTAGTTFVTQSWFDAKAPRRVRIEPETTGSAGIAVIVALLGLVFAFMLFDWLVLVPLAFVLLHPRARKGVRAGVTKWIDGLDQPA